MGEQRGSHEYSERGGECCYPVAQVHIANDHGVRGHPCVWCEEGHLVLQRDDAPLPAVGLLLDVQRSPNRQPGRDTSRNIGTSSANGTSGEPCRRGSTLSQLLGDLTQHGTRVSGWGMDGRQPRTDSFSDRCVHFPSLPFLPCSLVRTQLVAKREQQRLSRSQPAVARQGLGRAGILMGTSSCGYEYGTSTVLVLYLSACSHSTVPCSYARLQPACLLASQARCSICYQAHSSHLVLRPPAVEFSQIGALPSHCKGPGLGKLI